MSERSATLPGDARKRLTAGLRSRPTIIAEVVESARSLPLVHDLWSARLSALPAMLQRIEEAASPQAYQEWTYNGLAASLQHLDSVRLDVVAMLVALAPFDVRDLPPPVDGDKQVQGANPANSDASTTKTPRTADALHSDLLTAIDQVVDTVLDSIEAGHLPPPVTVDLSSTALPVPTMALEHRGLALAAAFGMSTVPVDSDGSFSPSRVFEAHKYANDTLLAYLLTHMQSLNLNPTDDMLSMILTTGSIVQAPDAVRAWQTLRSTMLRLENASPVSPVAAGNDQDPPNRSTLDAVLNHLADREEALRQSRRVVQTATRALRSTSDSEEAAHALADVYRRLVEGPVRHYGWAMRCLANGSWTPPPMMGSLADGFVIDPWLNAAVVPFLLPDVRNGQAHEALEWDGHRGVYVVEGVDVDYQRVNIAVADCMSFALGFEAALVHWRALAAAPGEMAPAAGQPGRMAEWRRVEALFGTNGLRIETFKFNARRVEARIERLDQEDINPSLQALVHARQLLPHVNSFAYYVPGSSEPVMEVDTSALDATHTVWLHAREHFDTMPLSTFLPANLNARLRLEPQESAAKAVSWIAIDCALDSIDALPPIWRAEHLWLVTTRIEHARLALRHASTMLEQPRRLAAALDVLDAVQTELRRLLPFTRAAHFDRHQSVRRLRTLWTTLGPAPRMPGIESRRGDPSPGYHFHPQRRTATPHDRWTNI